MTSLPIYPAETLEALDRLLAARPARLHDDTRLVVIDGPAGSGKSSLAAELQNRWHAAVIHIDDLYLGWDGVAAGIERLITEVIEPLHRDGVARFQRYDWVENRLGETVTIQAAPVVIVEGCHSAQRELEPLTSVLCWVEADEQLRLGRGLDRDGEFLRERWLEFMADERIRFAALRTRDRSDIQLDAWGKIVRDGLHDEP